MSKSQNVPVRRHRNPVSDIASISQDLIANGIMVGNQEIVDIRINELEKQLSAEMSNLKSRQKEAEDIIASTTEKLQKLIGEISEAEFMPKMEAVANALCAVPELGKIKANVAANWDPSKREYTITFGLLRRIKDQDNYDRQELTSSVTRKFNSAMNSYHDTILSMKELIGQLGGKMAEIRVQQGNFPSLERAVRAELAKAKLESTEEGRSLLARIGGVTPPKALNSR